MSISLLKQSECKACGLLSGTQCQHCGHFHFETANRNLEIYSQEQKAAYYQGLEEDGAAELISAARLAWLAGAGLPLGARILDVGCGVGTFVKVANQYGYEAIGCDGAMVGQCQALGRPAFVCDLDNLAIKGTYQAVTAFDVIEHVENPKGFVDNLAKITEGYLLLATPNAEGVFEVEKWKHYKPGEHLHGFTQAGLLALLKRCGWKIKGVSYLESVFRPNGDKNILTVLAENTC